MDKISNTGFCKSCNWITKKIKQLLNVNVQLRITDEEERQFQKSCWINFGVLLSIIFLILVSSFSAIFMYKK